jgi:Bcr/CflA subfamily drug resistance transporter
LSGLSVSARSTRLTMLIVLCALTAIAPFSMDVYTPALPALADDLAATDAQAQATVTMCVLGIAVGQLLLGPVSDSYGRRPVILLGAVGWTIGSILCMVAPALPVFFTGRILQGIFGGAAIVIARAAVSDLFTGPDVARHLSLLSAVATVCPVIAPVLGGVAAEAGGWRADFLILVVLGVLLSAGIVMLLPETLHSSRRQPFSIGTVGAGIGMVLRRPAVARAAATIGFAAFSFFAYIASSTFVIQETLGASQSTYIVLFATNALAAFAASMTYRRFAHRVPVRYASIAGTAIMSLGGGLVLVAALGGFGLATLWCGLVCFTAGWGCMLPSVTAAAQSAGRDRAGSTSALIGAAQFTVGAAGAPLVGLFPADTTLPFALVLLGGSVLALLVQLLPLQNTLLVNGAARGVRRR